MNLLFIATIASSLLLTSGCNFTKNAMQSHLNVEDKNTLGIYEGTYTRRVRGGGFVDGKTGKLLKITVAQNIDLSFTKEIDNAQKKTIEQGNSDYSNITHIKVKGSIGQPPEINNYGYTGTLNIERSIFVRLVRSLIPPDCFKTGTPCSSDGMVAYQN